MPGYMTHYIFGINEYKKLEEGYIKECITANRKVYNIGLQGPDIFFYFPFFFVISKNNPGSIMHRSNVKKCISNFMEYAMEQKGKDKEICIAYLAGYMGHFNLDRMCHPYIYHKTGYMYKDKNYHAKHVALETDIDHLLIKERLKKHAADIHYGKLIELNKRQLEVVSKMISCVCTTTYDEIRLSKGVAEWVLVNVQLVINFFNRTSDRVQRIIEKMEYNIMGKNFLAPMFNGDWYKIKNIDPMNRAGGDWYNPWETGVQYIENVGFVELINRASKEQHKCVVNMERALSSGNIDVFCNSIDNVSFLSNLEVE